MCLLLGVPLEGLEPPLPCGNAILSRARLPFRHRGYGSLYPPDCLLLSGRSGELFWVLLGGFLGVIGRIFLLYNRRHWEGESRKYKFFW